jgi:hypothetical protein
MEEGEEMIGERGRNRSERNEEEYWDEVEEERRRRGWNISNSI